MLVATDVAYLERGAEAPSARAAAVGFTTWGDAEPLVTWVESVDEVAPYVPGQFFRRELPCIWPLVQQAHARTPLEVVIIDGFVDLGPDRAGLGRHLFEQMRAAGIGAAVVGVAKNAFEGALATPVLRGESRTPLWVTAAGMAGEDAAQAVLGMHGPYRFPTLLRWVDQLANDVAPSG